MKKLRCVMVDDEPLALALIKGYVERTPFMECAGAYLSAEEAASAFDSSIDVVFLDINMPGLTGLDLARVVPSSALVIFTTAHREYALDSYEVHAFDYLLKPLSYPRFLESAVRVRDIRNKDAAEAVSEASVSGGQNDYIFVKCDYRMVRVDTDKILYIKGLKDYVCIYTTESDRALIALTTMKAIEDKLPASKFCRVHRSYIVNIGRIDSVERGRISIGKENIVVSDGYRKQFFDIIEQ